MNVGLEFHDSNVGAVQFSASSACLFFEPAYLHHSMGRPGVDDGTGHTQPVDLLFGGALIQGYSQECSGQLSGGKVSVNGVAYSVLPVPFQASGEISATFVFCTGEVFALTATSVSCKGRGAPSFVETYAA